LKIALVTDTHFGARNDNQNFNEYFYKFYDTVFFPLLKERGITTCIHLGDVMDRRKFVSYKIATDFRKRFLERFAELGIDLHLLIGNHDTYYKNTNEVNSMDELVGTTSQYDKVSVYSAPQVVDFDGIPIQLIPWINAANYDETMTMLSRSPAQIACGHLEINGFEMYKGMPAEGSYDAAIFRNFDMVMSGHFHHKSDDGHIFYLGTPYELYWNDYNDPKGFHILDTEKRELERIINPLKIFEKIYYDDSDKDYVKHNFDRYKEKYVKLIVVNKKDLYQFDVFVDKLLKADAYEVKIIEDFSELDAKNVSDDIVENTQDTMSLLELYIDELTVDLDKKRLKNTMRALYTEAQDLEI